MKKVFSIVAALTIFGTAAFAQTAPAADKKVKKAKAEKTATKAVANSAGSAPASSSAVKPAPKAAAVSANTPKVSGVSMKFETETIDYGTITKGAERVRKFYFVNNGTEDLVIKNAKGSCGCTVPTYPKEPIKPGERAAIEVNYDTQRLGAFTKTVTLTTNAPEGQDTKVLTIKGLVEDVPAGTPEKAPGLIAPAGH